MEVETTNKGETRGSPPTGLAWFVQQLSKIVNPINGAVGANISSLMLAAMMFLTFFDVAGRFLLNRPINGSLEITEFLMGILVSFALGYCALRKGHIRVDLVLQFTPRKVNQWLNIFAYGFSCLFFALVTWQGWLNALTHLSNKLSSSVLLIPVYPFVFLMTIGAAFVTLVFLRDFLQSIDEVAK